jgi:hypothetical protein
VREDVVVGGQQRITRTLLATGQLRCLLETLGGLVQRPKEGKETAAKETSEKMETDEAGGDGGGEEVDGKRHRVLVKALLVNLLIKLK